MSKFTPAFKAKVAIDAIKEMETVQELAKRYSVSPSKITEWKDEFLAHAEQAFERDKPKYIHPYLLRGMDITSPNQVWSTDFIYIPMKGGFIYLYAVIDVYSRFIVGWSLDNTLSASNCKELMEDYIRVWGAPEIVNTDQGSQYTTKAWEDLLSGHGIRISMDGRGWCKDNIWIERFWRTIKQEYIYLNPAETVDELRKRHRRIHQILQLQATAPKP